MIRRHAFGFRLGLMLADGLLAAALLVGLSIWRFGADWAYLWRLVIPEPTVFLVVYAIGWVVALTMNGLYRPRARWSLRSEATDVLRATGLMALATLSVLFLFKLPDVSRLFLLVLFPVQAVATIVVAGRPAMDAGATPAAGRNLRYVLDPRRGAAGQAFAAKLESHRELGLRVIGFLDDDSLQSPQRRWPLLGVARRPGDDPPHAGRRRGGDLPAVLAVGPDRRDRRACARRRARSSGSRWTCWTGRSRRGASRSSTGPRCSRSCRAPIGRSRWSRSARSTCSWRPSGSCSCRRSCS